MKLDYAIRWTRTPQSLVYGWPGYEQTDFIRDDSGEVLYYDEDTAIAEAMREQDKNDRFSYTVEHRPQVIDGGDRP